MLTKTLVSEKVRCMLEPGNSRNNLIKKGSIRTVGNWEFTGDRGRFTSFNARFSSTRMKSMYSLIVFRDSSWMSRVEACIFLYSEMKQLFRTMRLNSVASRGPSYRSCMSSESASRIASSPFNFSSKTNDKRVILESPLISSPFSICWRILNAIFSLTLMLLKSSFWSSWIPLFLDFAFVWSFWRIRTARRPFSRRNLLRNRPNQHFSEDLLSQFLQNFWISERRSCIWIWRTLHGENSFWLFCLFFVFTVF